MDSAMTWCLLWGILVFLPSGVFLPGLIQLSAKRWENSFHYHHIYNRIKDSRWDSHGQSARVRQQHVLCVPQKKKQKSVPSVMWLWLWTRLQAYFPLFSTQQEIWSPWTDSQGLSQCIWGIVHRQADRQKHSVTLFLASAKQKHIIPFIVTLWTLLATPAYLRFEKDVEGLKTSAILLARRKFPPPFSNIVLYTYQGVLTFQCLQRASTYSIHTNTH